jgi:hypothetical protein
MSDVIESRQAYEAHGFIWACIGTAALLGLSVLIGVVFGAFYLLYAAS